VDGYFGGYAVVGLLFVVGIAFVAGAFAANRLLRPSNPTREKLLTYECGVDPVGEGWAQAHIRYYVFAYLYVVFAVDAVYLFPWSTIVGSVTSTATLLIEMGVFVGFLTVGLLYAWRRDVLKWV
jgi:NADH-quinone oxidoreductase subunit A